MYYKQAIEQINQQLLKDRIGFWKRIDMNVKRIMNEAFISMNKKERRISKSNLKLYSEITLHKFAPIYDSGCCLGREYEESKVYKIINDLQMIEAYVRKGESEIHWEGLGKKSKHFELVSLLIQNYPNETNRIILRTKDNFNKTKVKEIIDNIDGKLPNKLINYKLSNYRKELMYKLITLRIEKLVKLI